MSINCLFCKIINKEITSEVIAENNNVLVIKDISPKAPVHYLIIPKEHTCDIRDLDNISSKDRARELMGDIVLMAQDLSKNKLNNIPFRLISNNGSEVGQSVMHIHFHFLAGKKFLDF